MCDCVTQSIVWSPSKMIARLGKEIDDPDSVYYWAYKVSVCVCVCACVCACVRVCVCV